MGNKKQFTVKRLVFDAMFAAICVVLGYVSIDLGNIKITFESLPILLGALMLGPADGALIGLVGTFLSQLLKYGVSATTVLWMLPYILCGLVAGAYAARRSFRLTRAQTVFIVVVAELLVTALNTGVLYLDSKIYGYYYPALIVGALALRLVICVAKAVVFGLILPGLVRLGREFVK